MNATTDTTTTADPTATAALKAHAQSCASYTASSNAAQAAKIALAASFIYRDSMTPRESAAYNKAQYLYDFACAARDEAKALMLYTKNVYGAACDAREALDLVSRATA